MAIDQHAFRKLAHAALTAVRRKMSDEAHEPPLV